MAIAIMKFMSRLVDFDSRYVAKIFDSLDLQKFILTNILIGDNDHIQTSAQFLRTLANDTRFADALFNLLVDLISNQFTKTIPPRNGYDAVIGMMHWAAPLDPHRALQILISTLYDKICNKVL